MTKLRRILLCLACLVSLLAAPSPAQFPTPPPAAPQTAFSKKQAELELEQSQRHLEYGLELRKQGLTVQSAAEIIRAAEIGKGRNYGASQVLSIMRRYDAAFWKRFGSRPSKGKLEQYDKKARGMATTEQKESLELGNWASTHGFAEEGQKLYVELLLERDEPLVFDSKDQIVLPAGTIPKKASAALREAAITINGNFYVRDELLAKLPELKEIFEVSSDDLRVRTTTTVEHARDLHAMCSQLLPALALDMGAMVQKRLALFVFAKRADYEKTLDALGLGDHKIVTGVATPWPFVAMVCMEGQPVEIVRGVCLHEITHLFSYATTPSVFPCWYSEGYADTFGGTGTFTWDGVKLGLQGLFDRSRIDALKAEGGMMPLKDMLAADQLVQWQSGKQAGLAFYAQSWAFLRYLRSGAGAEIAARLDQWEMRCMGQALGYQVGARRPLARGPASDLFMEMFGNDLPQLEAGFRVWLSAL
ncbi:MAG TPA: hypothetical protein VK843_11695 [Planctomycetota bacterium]|nr:hypothetical protein [Planctomycetota bacterium]